MNEQHRYEDQRLYHISSKSPEDSYTTIQILSKDDFYDRNEYKVLGNDIYLLGQPY